MENNKIYFKLLKGAEHMKNSIGNEYIKLTAVTTHGKTVVLRCSNKYALQEFKCARAGSIFYAEISTNTLQTPQGLKSFWWVTKAKRITQNCYVKFTSRYAC